MNKKFYLLVLCLLISLSLTACGDNDTNSKDNVTSSSLQIGVDDNKKNAESGENKNSTNIGTDSSQNNQPQTHEEYVKTYSVYAEQGAVVTWFDSKTGQFRYKEKCETCGQIAGGEHSGGLFVGDGTSYNAGFTCTNSNCSMWGKSQRAIIGCSTSGDWVEVSD